MGTVPHGLARHHSGLVTIDDQFDAPRIADTNEFVMLYHHKDGWHIDVVPEPNADATTSTPVEREGNRWEEAAAYAVEHGLPLLTYSKRTRSPEA
jgi:hypothetical protein